MAKQMKQPTTTQIRNFYSPGLSYLNLSFFNNGISFRFAPFQGQSQNGRDRYDLNNAETTVINYDKAFALYELTKNIVDHKIEGCKLDIDCNGGKLSFIYNGTGTDPTLILEKNGRKIEFRFETTQAEIMKNGQRETKYLNSQLGVLMKTLDGYLSGVNSDRHLNKLTDDYIASLQNKEQNGNNQRGNYQGKGGYQNNRGSGGGGYRSNSGGGNRSYNGGGQAPQQPSQNLDDYEMPF